jgi:hypothetical protein
MTQQEEIVINKIKYFLTLNGIKFETDFTGNDFEFTIYKGSQMGDIYIEEILSEDSITYHLNTLDKIGGIDYIFNIEEESNYDTFEENLYQLIESMVLKSKIIPKISSKINQIQDLCETLGVPLDKFIEVNYNL